LTLDLGEDGSAESASHASEGEFGREGESRELGLSGVLERERFEANEVLVAGGTDGSIRYEVNGRNLGNIHAAVQGLQKSLLLSISSINGNLGRSKVCEGGGRSTILPLNNS